jgi:hypothetical protein
MRCMVATALLIPWLPLWVRADRLHHNITCVCLGNFRYLDFPKKETENDQDRSSRSTRESTTSFPARFHNDRIASACFL